METNLTNWNNVITDFRTSGLSMKEYCIKYGYTYYIFGYYKRKFDKDNNFTGFIEVKDEIKDEPKNQEYKPEPSDNGLIEIKIKEITIKLDNKKIINLVKEILS